MLLLWMSAHGPAENNQTGDCVSEPWKVFLITVHLRSIRVTKTNLMTFLNKGNGRKYWGSGLDTHTSNLLTLNSLYNSTHVPTLSTQVGSVSCWFYQNWVKVFNTILDSLGRKKGTEKPWCFNARSLQRHINHEEFQGLTQKPLCKCTSWTKGQCSFQGRGQYWFPAFFL